MRNIEMSLEEIKKCEINILKKIDKICRENKLKYSLMGGSAIGAIRHQGFIPWDDDIDIMMLREDYDKLKDIMAKQNKDDNLLYMSCDIREDYPYPYAKVVDLNTEAKECGIERPKDYCIFIDIFPIDKIINDKNTKNRFLKYMKVIYKIYFIKLYKKQISNDKMILFIKRIISFLLKPINLKKLVCKLDIKSQTFRFSNTNNYAIILNPTTIKKKISYDKNFLTDVSYYKFEDTEFLMINGYDKYLTDIFGNYMDMPPKEKRVTNHNWEYVKKKEKK